MIDRELRRARLAGRRDEFHQRGIDREVFRRHHDQRRRNQQRGRPSSFAKQARAGRQRAGQPDQHQRDAKSVIPRKPQHGELVANLGTEAGMDDFADADHDKQHRRASQAVTAVRARKRKQRAMTE